MQGKIKEKKGAVLFIGGHHTAALPVIDFMKKEYPDVRLIWVGRKFVSKSNRSVSLEFEEVALRRIPFFVLESGKFYGNIQLNSFFLTVKAFFQSLILLLKLRPDTVISFGGYLAVPVVLSAFILRIPVITHEQTVVAGYANRLIGFFSKKILLSWPDSLKYYPRKKSKVIGLPLSESFFKKESGRLFNNGKKTIFVTGGKEGAHFINSLVERNLPYLLKKFNVIHLTGTYGGSKDFERLSAERERFDKNFKSGYLIKKKVVEEEYNKFLKASDFAVSRSGAHTCAKLLFLRKPALLIPLPRSSHNEQLLNALQLRRAGLAVVLKQPDIKNNGIFRRGLEDVSSLIGKGKRSSISLSTNAAEAFVEEIVKLLP